jgi:hypothetical protein
MDETIKWRKLDKDSAQSLLAKKVLALRGDGRAYAGKVIEVDSGTVTLATGTARQVLAFTAYVYQVAVFVGPPPWEPRLGDPKLNL